MNIKLSDDDLVKIEKKLIKFRKKELNAYIFYSKNTYKLLIVDFLEGVFKGLGFFFGATVIITLTIYITTKYLSNIPVIGKTFQNLGFWLEQQQNTGLEDFKNHQN